MQSTNPSNAVAAAEPAMPRAALYAIAAPRFDLYLSAHKGLRSFMSEVLDRCGRVDTEEHSELADTLARVRGLLEACRVHLRVEEQVIHPAMEARRGGSSRRTGDDHAAHLRNFEAIQRSVQAVETAHDARSRADTALRLYRLLALFIAENFEHMHVEETENAAVLWAEYSDAELRELHEQIARSSSAAERAVFLRWTVPALAPAERAALLAGLKRSAPPEAFAALLAMLKPHLGEHDWNKLIAALAGL